MLFALDRSSRAYDIDGHMHVRSVVSRACVSEYQTEQIPNWEQLGLKPGQLVPLYRDPAELEKAACRGECQVSQSGLHFPAALSPANRNAPRHDLLVKKGRGDRNRGSQRNAFTGGEVNF